MSIYVAIIEADKPGVVKPLWTSRDPEILSLIRKQINKRLTPVREERQGKNKATEKSRG